MEGKIHSIETFGAVDGPGIRYVIFVQGCPLRCLFCHNPDSWNLKDGKTVCSEDLVKNILEYRNFIEKGGVTISGGEPLFQPEFVSDILDLCRKNNLHTALDTAGSVPIEISKPVIDKADMLLLDIKALGNEMCRTITGLSNKNTLDTLNYTREVNKPIWIRHVLLPGYSFTADQLEELAEFLTAYPNIEKVELLPFHKMGEYKWEELGLPYEEAKELLLKYGSVKKACDAYRANQ